MHNTIHQMVLLSPRTIKIPAFRKLPRPSLLGVCKQVSDEAGLIYRARHCFRVAVKDLGLNGIEPSRSDGVDADVLEVHSGGHEVTDRKASSGCVNHSQVLSPASTCLPNQWLVSNEAEGIFEGRRHYM